MSTPELSAALKYTVESTESLEVKATNASAERRCWLLTKPIDGDLLKFKGSLIQIKTESHHQGWVSNPDAGSWSWFELAIISSNSPIGQVTYDHVKQADGKKLAWVSHCHPVDQNGKFEPFSHSFLGSHEVWKYFQVGERLAVFGCAQFPKWACHGRAVELTLEGECPDPKPDDLSAYGTITRGDTSNRITCTFTVDEEQKIFDATVIPSVPAFTSKVVKMTYQNKDDLIGTLSFEGYIGKKDCKITLLDENKNPIITMAGDLNEPGLKVRNQVRGSGTWMSS